MIFQIVFAVFAALGLIVAAALVVLGLKKRAVDTTEKKGTTLVKVGLAAGSVIFGLLLLQFCYDLTVANDSMSARTYQIVRLTVGLAAGFVATGLAGPFEISKDWQNATIKAGGPTGVAIFFYLVNPMAIGA